MRILALIWHRPHEFITAGGILRTAEILRRTPEGVEVLLLDNHPSFLSPGKPAVRVREYRIPGFIKSLESRWFTLERLLEWLLSCILMSVICVQLRLRGERFDLVFVPSAEQVPALVAAILAKWIFTVRLVACNMNVEIFPRPVRRPFAWLHNWADTVITLSKDLRGDLEHYGVWAPIEINGAGLDYSYISTAVSRMSDEKLYEGVFVGRHDREKGVFDLVRLWRAVVDELPGSKLMMIGSCNPVNHARLESLISELGLNDSITLAGVVSDREKLSIIKASKVCVFPSYIEGWAIAPQECLACGLPVVAYDLPVYDENIAHCESVFTVRKGNWRGAAGKVVELLRGDGYGRYADAGPEFVQQYDWDRVAAREFDILRGEKKVAGRGEPDVPKTFTVLIPALNEGKNIGSLLDDVVGQRLPDNLVLQKIIVISDGSTDNTEDVVRERCSEDPRLELMSNRETLGKGQSLNTGKRGVTSDYLVLLDGDIRLRGPDTVRRLMEGAADDVGLLGGNPVPAGRESAFVDLVFGCGEILRNNVISRLKDGNSLYSANGRMMAMSRELYTQVEIPVVQQGAVVLSTDQYLYLSCLKLGMRYIFQPEAHVLFKIPAHFRDYLRQSVRFVFSASNVQDYFQDRAVAAEYRIPLRVKVVSFANLMGRKPLGTVCWMGYRVAVRLMYIYRRYILKKGMGAAWEVSSSTKDEISVE